jgi:hypothetical protein
MEGTIARCTECNEGLWVPFSDFHHGGAAVQYKAWACTNPNCGFGMRIDRGDVSYIRVPSTK